MTPQKATLDSKRTLSWFLSYRRLSPQFQFLCLLLFWICISMFVSYQRFSSQFQFSLSAAALDMYLYGSRPALSSDSPLTLSSDSEEDNSHSRYWYLTFKSPLVQYISYILFLTPDQGFGSALIKCGSGYGSGSRIFSNCGSSSRSQCGSSSRSRVLIIAGSSF